MEKEGHWPEQRRVELQGDGEEAASSPAAVWSLKQSKTTYSGQPVLALRPLKIVTAEAELEKLMRRAMELSVGEIQLVEGRLQKLVHNGRELFRGYQLSNASGAKNGMVAVAAYDSDRKGIDDADLESDFRQGKLQVSTAAVWLLHAGERERISPTGMHADYPCISPDGTRVAYTGRLLNEQGMPAPQRLYLFDSRTKQTSVLDVENRGRVAALYWEGESLAVYSGALEASSAAVTFFKMPSAPVASR